MSTFKGCVEEFPHIRIDYFRKSPDTPPPLACFLSHVHSDHLQGLESLKAPFIYCSPTTRELLLRIEKYPHRMNFAKGILETRKQHYRHLKNLLKTIPLETPTEIELGPQAQLRVTLFDANHCAGAVMFLIEGDGKAVLYTGDIRSEAWWVNSIVRNPLLIPYTLGDRRLDKIYLDTTFAGKSDPYRVFPSKAEGLKELLAQVARYPAGTTFHLNSWTFGYEQVWIALSAALGSQVHVDRYKMGLYKSLATISGDGVSSYEGPALCGYRCGNRLQPGCLTSDQHARLHSCERGIECSGIGAEDVVWITPIITRTNTGEDVAELGAGGGGGDLDQTHELELNDTAAVGRLITLCSTKIQDPHLLAKVINVVSAAMASETKTLSFDGRFTTQDAEGNISLMALTEILSLVAKNSKTVQKLSNPPRSQASAAQKTAASTPACLPRHIRFPYSRHSSYEELCHLVDAFKPKDVYPCTTDVESWHEGISIQSLFGHLCSSSHFTHDREMRRLEREREALRNLKRKRDELSQQHCSQDSISTTDGGDSDPDTGMAKDVSQSARPEKTPGETKRHRSRVAHVRTEEPNHARPAMRLLKTPSTATQKAFEHPSNQEEVIESRLQTTLETVSSRVFRCAWLGCHEGFRTIGMLSRHVASKHLVKVAVNKPVKYGCLWRSCAEPNILYFASEELWEAHMDEVHYHAEMQRFLDQGKSNEQQDPMAGSQSSLPSPPVEDGDAQGTHLALEPGDLTEDVQAIPIQPSNQPNEPRYQTDSGFSADIKLKGIHDPTLRKKTTAQANTHWLSRQASNSQVDAVTQLHRSSFRNNDYSYHPQYADKINRLRKAVPTASKQACLELLWLHKGDSERARELVAQYEEMRLASVRSLNDIRIQSHGVHQPSRHESIDIDNDVALPNDDINRSPPDDNTDASYETAFALSLSTSAFHTPASTPTSRSSSPARSPQISTRTPTSPSRLRHRREAYEAARGIGGSEWAVYSPVSAGNNHSVLEVEL